MLHSDASCSNGRYANPALRQGATGTPTLHPPLYPPSSPPLPQNEGGAFQGTQSTQGGNVGGTVRTATNPSSSKAKARLAPLGKAHSWVQRVVLPLGCLSSTVEPPDAVQRSQQWCLQAPGVAPGQQLRPLKQRERQSKIKNELTVGRRKPLVNGSHSRRGRSHQEQN
jgi:hypothetical protein